MENLNKELAIKFARHIALIEIKLIALTSVLEKKMPEVHSDYLVVLNHLEEKLNKEFNFDEWDK